MVHALGEIRRTLKPDGILIDLRPVEDNWSVEIPSASGLQIAGRLTDLPIGQADDEAAFAAMREAEARGWFVRERREEFAFFVTTYPHPNPLPKGEGTERAGQISLPKTAKFAAFAPLSQRERGRG